MITEEEIAYIGKFGKPHGYNGEINFSFSQFTDERFLEEGFPIIVDVNGIYVPFYIAAWRTKGSDYLLKIEDYESQEKVRRFVNREAFAMRRDIEKVCEDFIYEEESDFDGYTLIDQHGAVIGEIIGFDTSTENFLMNVRMPDGREVILPIHDDFILAENREEKILEVRLPDGLLDLND